MALTGSLEDVGVIELIQFAHQGRRTGVLNIRAQAGQAQLYYRAGNLIHARSGGQQGLEVLVEVADWESGDFEFQQGVEADSETIGMDLHRAVMSALKIRDERRAEEARRKAEEERMRAEQEKRRAEEAKREAGPSGPPAADPRLMEMIEGLDFVDRACLLDASGTLLAAAHGPRSAPDDLATLRECLGAFLSAYPRSGVRRLFVEDEEGTVVVARVGAERALVVVAERNTLLGPIAVGMNRLVARLNAA